MEIKKIGNIVVDAENETFIFDSSFKGYITYKPTGQKIYQMQWCAGNGVKDIEDENIVKAAREFLSAISEAGKKTTSARKNDKPEQRGNGWCEKCQSYCYGDCEA